MFAIVSLVLIIIISMIVVRVATVALTLTGLSNELARFQARSAFTSTGFTTSETEKVMRHPVRRRIIMMLMLFGNAGIVTAVSSLILSFIDADMTPAFWLRIFALIFSVTILWMVSHSAWIDNHISEFIKWALQRWTDLELRDYAGLLHLTDDYIVVEMSVQEDDWLADQSLIRLKLTDEGVLVLGIERADGVYIGAPRGDTVLGVNDVLLLYGKAGTLKNLDERCKGAEGNWEHHKAVEQQQQVILSEQEEQELHEKPAP
ncbi:TrkA-C domain protein [Polystyrenella longa]|uniref:TrkA-C domain protein n=1 Tax=Polystyrenella longa TaxID=2528007 RepID=A0A518CGK7_9PLAN|nr:TrkA C-terminal domain-containing protein [Polystyrenella longa]QDU78362.1 TrkA-C domain protein [Polystyrenella longa]